MSWLAPLYLWAACAIAAPVVIHLWQAARVRPMPFSSLMFVPKTPVRLPGRRRIRQWWLLLLRSLVILLLACAFARPFVRRSGEADKSTGGREVVVLVDVSASMRRAGIQEARNQLLQTIVGELAPSDRCAFVAFDEQIVAQTPWLQTREENHAAVSQIQRDWQPSWRATEFGRALRGAIELLTHREPGTSSSEVASAHRGAVGSIVIVSDLQQGASWADFENEEWPASVTVELRPLAVADGNAAVRVMMVEDDEAHSVVPDTVGPSPGQASSRVRVRLTCDATLPRDVQIKNNRQADDKPGIRLPMAQGRRVVVCDDDNASIWSLQGDVHDFDNHWYVTPRVPKRRRVVWLGGDPQDPSSMAYYVQRADLSTPTCEVEFTHLPNTVSFPWDAPRDLALCGIEGPPDANDMTRWRAWLEQGGRLLVTLPVDDQANSDLSGLAGLLNAPQFELRPLHADTYQLWTAIDFRDAVMLPFAGPQLGDFSKIRTWRYQQWNGDVPPDVQVLARWEAGSPAFVARTLGQGRLLVWFSSARPSDSQWAWSSKFVPLLGQCALTNVLAEEAAPEYTVGEKIKLDSNAAWTEVVIPSGERKALAPDKRSEFVGDQPGIYRFARAGAEQAVAVNLNPAESLTQPMDRSEWTQRGVIIENSTTRVERTRERQREADATVEQRQSLWRGGIIAALGVLMLETWIAGRMDRGTSEHGGAFDA